MKTSSLGKKLSQIGMAAAVTGVFMMAPLQAQATSSNWSNLDGSGSPLGVFIELDALNTIASPQLSAAIFNVGADKTLNNGDVFTEKLTVITNSSSLGAGGTVFGLGGDYRFEAAITGVVSNTNGSSIILNDDNSVTTGADSVFDIVFNSATIGLFNNVTNEHIADLNFLSGGASNIQLVAGTFISDITLNSLLGPGCANCDPYILDAALASILGSEILTITSGSSRLLNLNDSSFTENLVVLNFRDNGESTTFISSVPEPQTYALMLAGLGLIGYMAQRPKASQL